jgi:hypothetical protein
MRYQGFLDGFLSFLYRITTVDIHDTMTLKFLFTLIQELQYPNGVVGGFHVADRSNFVISTLVPCLEDNDVNEAIIHWYPEIKMSPSKENKHLNKS